MENSKSSSSFVTLAAIGLLGLMATLMVSSAWDDDFTNDEVPHVGAGYSYLLQRKYHFNTEHPPIMKDLGALPLVFMKLRAPWGDKSWKGVPLDEWDFGLLLLFKSGADASALLRASRAPLILFTLAFGWLLFSWTRRHFDNVTALLTLFFFVFSPTILAHGRLVTTDMGAAAGMFVGVAAFLRMIGDPTKKNVFLAGIALGFALLTKFSTIELIPILAILAVTHACVEIEADRKGFLRLRGSLRPSHAGPRHAGAGYAVRFRPSGRASNVTRAIGQAASIFGIAFAVVYLIYYCHNLNYTRSEQRADTTYTLDLNQMTGPVRSALQWASDKPVIRPFDTYLLGLAGTLIRSSNGNGPYFRGEYRATGSRLYFPFVYLVKEPLALHVLTLLAIGFALSRIRRRCSAREWIARNFNPISLGFAAAFYWAVAIRSNLNIGVRHILPVFPFLFVLVACGVASVVKQLDRSSPLRRPATIALALLLLWQAASVIRAHPFYMPYFSELAGGRENGWRYVVDSNVDWGQDLKRLARFAEREGIQKLYFDYFGASDLDYYFHGRQQIINSCSEPVHGWVAVSAMWYQESGRNPKCDYRRWLPMDKLTAKIGYSIFVFHVP